jgi:uncharacterized protein (DUF2225 family)
MTTTWPESFTCPIDGEVFEEEVVVSSNRVGTHTDFRPMVMGVFAIAHEVHACPKCGFAGYEDDFSAEHDDDFKAWVLSELGKELATGPLEGGLKHVLAARCAERRGGSAQALANLYIRGAWCASGEDTPKIEARCRREATRFLAEALESKEVEARERANATYLVGELFRRLGDTKSAATWFDKVAAEIVDHEEQAWILDAATTQKTNPVDVFE